MSRAAAIGAIQQAEKLNAEIPEVLTVGAIQAIKEAQKAILLAMRCTLERVDEIEL